MFTEVLQSIGGVHVYPVLSLILFVVAFSLVVVWALSMNRSDVQRWSRLPLDSGGDEPSDAGDR
ncbi:MAG: CcoQ/FixQ family Cbb3-type cytochrome c oxidase assembly chaperone [Bacteroidetes bacterium]|nr:CcoQ/FixQ family Cbb3-type cytochrome c oxidase assembly chaperone [Bacteroidota bacterium]